MLKTVQIIINSKCNCFCKMCDIGLARLRKKQTGTFYANTNFSHNLLADTGKNLSLQEYEAFIHSLPPGTKIYINATEPLLSKNLFPILHCIGRAKEKFPVYLTTNGLLLKKFAEQLAQTPLSNICISLDGPPAIHDSIRGIKGLFEHAFCGMTKLRSLRPDLYMRTSTAISHLNQSYLLELAQMLKPLRLQSMLFNHLNFITNEMAELHNRCYGDFIQATSSCVALTPPEKIRLPSLCKEIASLRNEFPTAAFYPDLWGPEEIVLYYRQPLRSSCGRTCNITRRSLSVAPDGLISLGQRCFHYPLGNVRTDNLSTVLRSHPWLQTFREKIMASGGYFPACTRCCGGFSNHLRQRNFPWTPHLDVERV